MLELSVVVGLPVSRLYFQHKITINPTSIRSPLRILRFTLNLETSLTISINHTDAEGVPFCWLRRVDDREFVLERNNVVAEDELRRSLYW